MRKTRALAAALAAGAIAAIAAVLPAQGHHPSTRTMMFTSIQGQGDEHLVEARPKGPSVGDRWLLSSTLRQAGKAGGRLEGDCVAIDQSFEVLQCSLIVILPDGRLTLQGGYADKTIPGVGRAEEEYAITGGTGAYVGASGTMRRKGNGRRDTLTFTLAP